VPRFDFGCICGEIRYDVFIPVNDETPVHCPLCFRHMTKRFDFTPQWNGSTIRHPGERTPAHSAWFNSDETQAKLRLPDGHPEKLEMLSKSSDAAHGVKKEPDFTVDRDDVQKDITAFWAQEKKEGRAVPAGAL
jgi:hypothetical protein